MYSINNKQHTPITSDYSFTSSCNGNLMAQLVSCQPWLTSFKILLFYQLISYKGHLNYTSFFLCVRLKHMLLYSVVFSTCLQQL